VAEKLVSKCRIEPPTQDLQLSILIAHRLDGGGAALLPAVDRRQITVAAFLNLYIAWETFLESSLTEFMIGSPAISGALPVKYVSPPNIAAARALIIGVQRYFDYGNHDYVRRVVSMYFQNRYPYEPHLSGISSDLADLRTMRNASAHITSTTQTALDNLAVRLFGQPHQNIDLHALLTAIDPSSPGDTVFVTYRNKLLVTAELIAQG
jgi:hypothetical protein